MNKIALIFFALYTCLSLNAQKQKIEISQSQIKQNIHFRYINFNYTNRVTDYLELRTGLGINITPLFVKRSDYFVPSHPNGANFAQYLNVNLGLNYYFREKRENFEIYYYNKNSVGYTTFEQTGLFMVNGAYYSDIQKRFPGFFLETSHGIGLNVNIFDNIQIFNRAGISLIHHKVFKTKLSPNLEFGVRFSLKNKVNDEK